MEPSPKILFTRAEAAEQISISVSSVDVMIARGMLRVTRKGRRVLIHHSEIECVAREDIPRIWPPKRDGKTVNRAVA